MFHRFGMCILTLHMVAPLRLLKFEKVGLGEVISLLVLQHIQQRVKNVAVFVIVI
jgi:hypothetical protein